MYLVVLNDRETYTDLDGCKILWIDDCSDDAQQDLAVELGLENPQGWIELQDRGDDGIIMRRFNLIAEIEIRDDSGGGGF